MSDRNKWVRRVQQKVRPDIQSPGWRLVEERDTGILECEGRVMNYQPIYLGGGAFEDNQIMPQSDHASRYFKYNGDYSRNVVDSKVT